MSEQPTYLTARQTAARLGLSLATLARRRRDRAGPPFRPLGRVIRYLAAEVDAWADQGRCE